MLKQITTTEGRVYVSPNGKVYPSVTTVLDSMRSPEDTEKLNKWIRKQNMLAGINQGESATERRNAAAFRGTYVDEWVNRYLIKRYDTWPIEEPYSEHTEFIDPLVPVLPELGKPLQFADGTLSVQKPVFLDVPSGGYAGTLDFALYRPDSGLTLWDLTTHQPHRVLKIMWRGHENWQNRLAELNLYPYFVWRKILQTTAYSLALEHMYGISPDNLGVLIATPKRAYTINVQPCERDLAFYRWSEMIEQWHKKYDASVLMKAELKEE
jgi:hypothetical protein